MPRLNKNQVYSILWLNQQGHSPEEISKETGATLKQIESTLSNHKTESPPEEPPKQKTSKDFMIHQTSAKNNRGVSIMTEAASQMNDAFRQANPVNNTKNSDHIHRIS